jgi:asparagine synthase (glutamine-hydrolysing)
MCGIAGILNLNRRFVDQAILQRMANKMIHRGPDDEGYYCRDEVGIAQRRLSIIDLEGGHQPISNENETMWIVCNGEIYNFQTLRSQLQQKGHSFKTQSDTEVILHAYEEHNENCLRYLRGMFAFALWDNRRKKLFLARDRAGKKPLFYASLPTAFVFASELQALLQHPDLEREVNPAAIHEYLSFGYIAAPHTAFAGVYKLPPAHFIVVDLSKGSPAVHRERYWQLVYGPKLKLDEAEAIAALQEKLSEAIKLRMISDVPIGALLSGGTDSSTVVALMSQLTSQPVKTFSIGFAEQRFNELHYARLVAKQYGTDHHEIIVRPKALEILPMLVRHYGEPFADSSAIPSFYVAQMARQHVTVALNGDGGDEDFAGYPRYIGNWIEWKYRHLPPKIKHGALKVVDGLAPDNPRHPLRRLQKSMAIVCESLPKRYKLAMTAVFDDEEKQQIYALPFSQTVAALAVDGWFDDLFAHCNGLDDIDLMLTADVQSYLPYDLLVKMDIASMANSLEARSPFLDHEVMEFAARLPLAYKLRGMRQKYLLVKLAGKLVPKEILYRPKMGFAMPIGSWFRQDLKNLLYETVLSPTALKRAYFRPQTVQQIVQTHINGQRDYGYALWALLMLELWFREFID